MKFFQPMNCPTCGKRPVIRCFKTVSKSKRHGVGNIVRRCWLCFARCGCLANAAHGLGRTKEEAKAQAVYWWDDWQIRRILRAGRRGGRVDNPECFVPEQNNPYPLCVGRDKPECENCQLRADWEPKEEDNG